MRQVPPPRVAHAMSNLRVENLESWSHMRRELLRDTYTESTRINVVPLNAPVGHTYKDD